MDEPNPYEAPQTASDPPQRPEIDGYYRLRQFLVMVVPAIVGAAVGGVVFPRFGAPYPVDLVVVGGLVGLVAGIALRIVLRRR